jgi:transposase
MKQTSSFIEETRIPCAPGQAEKIDSEYVRKGVADVFMAFEPLGMKRVTKVTETRTAIDFANFLKMLADVHYPYAEKIVLVMDNLNTHTTASLYKAFTPEEAWRIAEKLEIHYTPKHGSWLNMAEIEIGVMSRQALSKPLSSLESFRQAVSLWNLRRNSECTTVNWQFTTADARIKLKRLYPIIS